MVQEDSNAFASPRSTSVRSSSAQGASPKGTLGTTFGASRQSYDKVASHNGWNFQPHDRQLPGPGQYKHKNHAADGVKYGLRERTVKNCKFCV